MTKKIYSLVLALLALTGFVSSCSDNEDIIFDHERQQFETRADRILLEFISPFGTTVDEEIYIVGAFNGDSAAIGQEQYLLTKAANNDVKFGIYLDPNSFVNGKTLADGYRFYSVTQGMEYNNNGELALHTENPAVGSFTNVWGQRWESYYWAGGDAPEPEHDGFCVYVDDQTGWDVLTLYMWGDINDMNGGWPGMAVTGTWKSNGTTWKYFDFGAANTGLNENLIFNNGGNGAQLADFNFTIDRNLYLRITAEGVEEVSNEPAVEHDGYALFVLNESSETELALYAWGDAEAFGSWPGIPVTGTQTIGGVEYSYFDMGEANTGLNLHLIPNNNNGGVQWEGDNLYFTIDHNIFIRIFDGGYEVIDGGSAPEPEPVGATYTIYVDNQTGWDALTVYAWGDKEIFGGWPGAQPSGTQNIGGVNFTTFSVTGNGESENLIFNNNGNGIQLSDFAYTVDHDVYLRITAEGVEEIDKPSAQTIIVALKNVVGYEDPHLYVWGDSEACGSWPGAAPVKTTDNGWSLFELPANGNYHLILNNNNNGLQSDGPEVFTDKSYFIEVGDGWAISENTVTIQNNAGYTDPHLYAWGDGEIYGGWRGLKPNSNENGTLVFPLPNDGGTYNLILNGEGDGVQQDISQVVANKSYTFTAN